MNDTRCVKFGEHEVYEVEGGLTIARKKFKMSNEKALLLPSLLPLYMVYSTKST